MPASTRHRPTLSRAGTHPPLPGGGGRRSPNDPHRPFTLLLAPPPPHTAPSQTTTEVLTPSQWLHIRHLAQPPLFTAHTCADHDDPFSQLVVRTSRSSGKSWMVVKKPSERVPPAGCSLSDVDLSGSDGRGNYQGEVTTACRELAVKDRMAEESAKLKGTWANLHQANPEEELRINRERLEDLDKDNIADLKKHTAARAFEILQKARNHAFNSRDEIKTLKRSLMKVNALHTQTAQSELAARIKCQRNAQDLRILQKMIDKDNASLENERQLVAERKREMWADGEQLREYLSGQRPVHEPPLRHDFGYLRRQAQHLREHNAELEDEVRLEEAEIEARKGHFKRMLEQQRVIDDEARKREKESDDLETTLRKAFIRDKIEQIINKNEYEAQLARAKVDSSLTIVQLAEERRLAEEAIQRQWDDAAGAHFKKDLALQDEIIAKKLRQRQEDLQDCLLQRHHQLEEAAKREELENCIKTRFDQQIIADVAAFHRETKEKEDNSRKGRRDWKNIWNQQKIERDLRDAADKQSTDLSAAILHHTAQQHKSDLLRYADHLAAQQLHKHPETDIRSIHNAVETVLNTSFKFI